MRFVGLGQKYAIFQATTSINARAFYITLCCFGSWSTKRKLFAECSIILLSTLSELATVHQLNLPAPSFQASRFSRLSRLNFFIETRSKIKLAFTKKRGVRCQYCIISCYCRFFSFWVFLSTLWCPSPRLSPIFQLTLLCTAHAVMQHCCQTSWWNNLCYMT